MSDTTLLTGATGFLGMELLDHLVRADDRPIVALVRAADQRGADERIAAVRAAVFGDARAHAHRVTAVPGDLGEPGLGLRSRDRAVLARRVGRIVHGAASVSFGSSLEEARAVNVAGTARVLDLAHGLADLEHLVHVSTAYVAGARRGVVRAAELDEHAPHRNPYERSKAEAERLVREAGLPATVVRPAIVVGRSDTGWTSSFNVVYGPLRAYALGTLTRIPGRAGAPVDVVPVDHVAAGIAGLLGRRAAHGRTVHLAAGDRATTVAELCALGAAAFGRPEPRIVPPRLYRAVVHPVLTRTGPEARRRGLRRGAVLLPYYDVRCTYDTADGADLLAAAGVAPPPPLPAYFDALAAFARVARWGRRPISRAQAAGVVPAARAAA